jgi:hypothetical protein
LVAENPDRARREAVLITKILQTVSNGVEFDGSKEDYMKRLNPFIKRNRLCVTVFFDNLTVSMFESQSLIQPDHLHRIQLV